MTDHDILMIRRLNVTIVVVCVVLFLITAGGIIAVLGTQPGEVYERVQSVESRIVSLERKLASLEERLSVRPADVLAEVQSLKAELRKLRESR